MAVEAVDGIALIMQPLLTLPVLLLKERPMSNNKLKLRLLKKQQQITQLALQRKEQLTNNSNVQLKLPLIMPPA
jgi:hypothetical protein